MRLLPLIRHSNHCSWYIFLIVLQIQNVQEIRIQTKSEESFLLRKEHLQCYRLSYKGAIKALDTNNKKPVYEPHNNASLAINTWVGILVDNLVVSYILTTRLDAHKYIICVTEILTEMPDNVPALVRRGMRSEHDGASSHYAMCVCNLLEIISKTI
ncbi:hypothetical protein NPIL_234941 [Nephila pilipes]|uniref:Uncharacterized protein n=1 Tax=Nephila pilipes TaxID=299642 RepID=A0A8X6P789_NEPPI|nr:hypothetical protein NPIL_234941 [Nephila pilipes]